jgi:sugar transferase (PEP-CTERM/EpsH1 system associated)
MTMSDIKPPLVAHIIYSLDTGGLENGLVNILNRSPVNRYRHVIICLTTAKNFSRRITAPNVEVIELHKSPGHDVRMYWRLWRALKALEPAIIHSRNLAALETHILALVMPGVKRVHGEHGRDVNDLDGSNKKYQLLRRFMRLFITAYVTVSKDLATWLEHSIGVPPHKIHQIYNGVDLSRFKPRVGERKDVFPQGFYAGPDTLVFGAVGRLAEVKDHKTLLLGFSTLIQLHPEMSLQARLIIVGGGPLAGTLSSLIDELDLTDKVWMTGDREDIPALLQLMDVFVLPSLAEGISNTVLEAMASGLPVIATNVGGNAELIETALNGLLVPVSNAKEMSVAMAELAISTENRVLLGANAVKKVKAHHDWDRTVSAYLDLYDTLLSRSKYSGKGNNSGTEPQIGASG